MRGDSANYLPGMVYRARKDQAREKKKLLIILGLGALSFLLLLSAVQHMMG